MLGFFTGTGTIVGKGDCSTWLREFSHVITSTWDRQFAIFGGSKLALLVLGGYMSGSSTGHRSSYIQESLMFHMVSTLFLASNSAVTAESRVMCGRGWLHVLDCMRLPVVSNNSISIKLAV